MTCPYRIMMRGWAVRWFETRKRFGADDDIVRICLRRAIEWRERARGVEKFSADGSCEQQYGALNAIRRTVATSAVFPLGRWTRKEAAWSRIK